MYIKKSAALVLSSSPSSNNDIPVSGKFTRCGSRIHVRGGAREILPISCSRVTSVRTIKATLLGVGGGGGGGCPQNLHLLMF